MFSNKSRYFVFKRTNEKGTFLLNLEAFGYNRFWEYLKDPGKLKNPGYVFEFRRYRWTIITSSDVYDLDWNRLPSHADDEMLSVGVDLRQAFYEPLIKIAFHLKSMIGWKFERVI